MKPFSVMISILAFGITSSAAMANGVSLPNVSPTNSELANRGAYIARAADCMSCHREDYSGGKAVETPIGKIYSTNITPSRRYGIGNYTEADFKKVLRKGRAPNHLLYPAMPYPSYHGMRDADISALFAYFQTVPAIDAAPEKTTNFPFPLNVRSLMLAWNAINVPATEDRKGLTQKQQRGEYLVNNLGHCGTCHTPRNITQGFDQDMYLSGAPVANWYAPNITPDKDSGIGRWSEQDITTYLRTGTLKMRAHASGPMGEEVAHSTSYLTDEDLSAIASYLKAVPAIKTDNTVQAVNIAALPNKVSDDITFNLLEQKAYIAQAKARAGAANSSKALYLSQCSSCHGVDGYGQPEAGYASIVGLSSIRRDKPDALLNVIINGVDSGVNTAPKMPGFSEDLTDDEIASIANYVRFNLGGLTSSYVSSADVEDVRKPNFFSFFD